MNFSPHHSRPMIFFSGNFRGPINRNGPFPFGPLHFPMPQPLLFLTLKPPSNRFSFKVPPPPDRAFSTFLFFDLLFSRKFPFSGHRPLMDPSLFFPPLSCRPYPGFSSSFFRTRPICASTMVFPLLCRHPLFFPISLLEGSSTRSSLQPRRIPGFLYQVIFPNINVRSVSSPFPKCPQNLPFP